MKKRNKIFAAIGVIAFTVIIAFNVNIGLRNNEQNNLILSNIEALAKDEGNPANISDCDQRSYANGDYCEFYCVPGNPSWCVSGVFPKVYTVTGC